MRAESSPQARGARRSSFSTPGAERKHRPSSGGALPQWVDGSSHYGMAPPPPPPLPPTPPPPPPPPPPRSPRPSRSPPRSPSSTPSAGAPSSIASAVRPARRRSARARGGGGRAARRRLDVAPLAGGAAARRPGGRRPWLEPRRRPRRARGDLGRARCARRCDLNSTYTPPQRRRPPSLSRLPTTRTGALPHRLQHAAGALEQQGALLPLQAANEPSRVTRRTR